MRPARSKPSADGARLRGEFVKMRLRATSLGLPARFRLVFKDPLLDRVESGRYRPPLLRRGSR